MFGFSEQTWSIKVVLGARDFLSLPTCSNISHDVIGFIAQEVKTVCPECVSEAVKLPGDETEYEAMDKLRMMADLVGAVKDLLERVEKLEG